MVGMRNSNVTEKIKCEKIDKYFYRNPEGEILKYSIIVLKKIAKRNHLIIMKIKSIYCVKHKLEKILMLSR